MTSQKSASGANRILVLSFVTYCTVYLLRTNFSAAIPQISAQLSLTESQLGLVGSAFFIVYAAGQLINGFISDAVSPYRFIVVALIGTVILNGAMAFSTKLWMLVVIWACNGYFQSVFWGCLQRILSLHFDDSRHSTIATVMSLSMIAGFLLSWVVLTNFLRGGAWQGFFLYPAICGLIVLAVWLTLCRKGQAADVPGTALSFGAVARSLQLIRSKRIYLICGICLCLGFIKESISVWGPTMIAALLGVDLQASALVLFLIPVGNFFGIFCAKFLADRMHRHVLNPLFPLFSLLLLAAGAMLPGWGVPVTVAMIVILSAMSYGCNSVLLSMVPLHYTHYGVVSTLIGIFDFSSYIGAAISSAVAGVLFTAGKWESLSLLWVFCGGMALLFAGLARRKTDFT